MTAALTELVTFAGRWKSQDPSAIYGKLALAAALLVTASAVILLVRLIKNRNSRREERLMQLLSAAVPAGYKFIDYIDFNNKAWTSWASGRYGGGAYNLLHKIDDDGLPNFAFTQLRSSSEAFIADTNEPFHAVFGIYVGGDFPSLGVRRQTTSFLKGRDLELDSSAFNDTFVVTVNDEKAATAFLHHGMMGYLLEKANISAHISIGGFHLQNGWLTTTGRVEGAYQGQNAYSWESLEAHLNYLKGIIELIPTWVVTDSDMVLRRDTADYSPLGDLFPGILSKVPRGYRPF